MVTKIYLVRHCQTVGNLNHIFQGQTDTDPSEEGLAQLDLLALRFRNIPIDVIYSSNLGRAVKTAQAINEFHNGPHLRCEGIGEITVGEMDGMDWNELPKLYPDQCANWNNTPWLFESPKGETMRDVYKRMSESFEKIANENAGKTVVLVSHGCALRNLLCYCSGKPIEELNTIGFGSNTAVTLVESENGKNKIVFCNDNSHLPEETRKKKSGAFFKI